MRSGAVKLVLTGLILAFGLVGAGVGAREQVSTPIGATVQLSGLPALNLWPGQRFQFGIPVLADARANR